ncbi:MAG: DNA-protecting protein DprA [Candidatus Rokubacteria bacterium]|nr:DNA-protecting protein DprA [Candidatus Rokubacteria bacterium]
MTTVEERDRWSSVAAGLSTPRCGSDSERTVAEQRARAERVGARVLLREDAAYPAQLRAVPAAPPFLVVRGELRDEDALAVAIVGARRATPYGLQVAEQLAGDLAARGVTVISGFARGVDTAAHRGALAVGGRTVAVLGSGADVIYPPENRALVARVIEHGALVSQFPMGTPPLPEHFPLRNRTIAGLALGTVVGEAAERSGALITAGHAGELGREVFAVPGNITSALARGSNRLIQDGAKLVQSWEDVVAELPERWRRCLVTPAWQQPSGPSLEADERILLDLVGEAPVHAAELIERSGVPSGRAAALLVTLELHGWVRQLPGRLYVRARRS